MEHGFLVDAGCDILQHKKIQVAFGRDQMGRCIGEQVHM